MLSNQYPTIVYGLVNGNIVPVGSVIYNNAGQLVLTPSSGGTGSGIAVFDPIQGGYRILTAPNGILTLSPVGG